MHLPHHAPKRNPGSKKHALIHPLLTTVTLVWAFGYLLYTLLSNGFWIDELYTLHTIRLGWNEMILERLSRGHFPGYFALVRLWYALWPEQQFELALRSFSVLFYLLSVISFWPFAKRFLPAPASWVALALFASNGILLRQASEARMYTLTLFIAVWITRAWLELQREDPSPAQPQHSRRQRQWLALLTALPAVGFVISTTTAVLLLSILAVGQLCHRAQMRRINKRLYIALFVGMLIFLPGAIIHLYTGDRVGVSSSKPLVFLTHFIALMPGIQLWDDYYGDAWWSPILVFIGGIVTALAAHTVWKNKSQLPPWFIRAAIASILPLAAIIAAWPIVELLDLDIMGPPRYFLTLLPLASLVGAWALMQLRRPLVTHALLTLILIASATAILSVEVERFRYQLVNYMKPRYTPGEPVIVTPHELADGVELYVPGSKVHAAVDRWNTSKEAIRQQLQPLGSAQRVWLVWYRGNKSPVIEVAEEMWGPFTVNRPEKPYGIVRIYQFHPHSQHPPE